MLVKTEENKVYRVRFTHYNDSYEKPGTSCEVFDQETNEVVSVGESFLNTKEDHLNKAVGRKISLARAIEYLPRELRILFWNKYWELHRA